MAQLRPLHPENVYGHTKKMKLMQSASAEMHERQLGRRLSILDVGYGNGFSVSKFLGFCGDDLLAIDFYTPTSPLPVPTFPVQQ